MLISNFKEVDRKAHQRKLKGRIINVKHTRVKTRDRRDINIAATALGISAGTFIALRTRYRANLPKHLSKVKEMALKINPDTIVDPKLVKPDSKLTMVLPGLTNKGFNREQDYIIGALQNTLQDPKRIYIKSTMDFFNTPSVTLPNKKLEVAANYANIPRTLLKNMIKGEHPDAIKAAAEVLALRKKYGNNLHIDMIGHSGGGMTFRETNHLLNHLGEYNTKSVSIGSPNTGVIPTPKNHIAINSLSDPVAKTMIDKRNLINVTGIQKNAHGPREYFKSEQFKRVLKRSLFGGTAAGTYTSLTDDK